jgi:hypothetical protein
VAVSRQEEQRLHNALWKTFVKADTEPPGAPGRKKVQIGAASSALRDTVDLLSRNRKKVPRSLLALALWNLLPGALDPAFQNEPAGQQLDGLLQYAMRLDLPSARIIYDETRDPLLVLARQYNIIDYRWQWQPQRDLTTASARLELCVQRRFDNLKQVVPPTAWSKHSPFWDSIRRAPTPRKQGSGARQPGQTNFHGKLLLPDDDKASAPVLVRLNVDHTDNKLSAVSDFEILGDGGVELCRGFLRVDKEPGRPGAARLTHEKQLRFAAGPSDNQRVGTLAYWVQAETVAAALRG